MITIKFALIMQYSNFLEGNKTVLFYYGIMKVVVKKSNLIQKWEKQILAKHTIMWWPTAFVKEVVELIIEINHKKPFFLIFNWKNINIIN